MIIELETLECFIFILQLKGLGSLSMHLLFSIAFSVNSCHFQDEYFAYMAHTNIHMHMQVFL